MNVSRISKRMAATGVATALAAGALVGAGTTAATAAPTTGSSVYNCSNPGLPQALPMQLSLTADMPISSLPSGYNVTGVNLPVDVVFAVPTEVVAALGAFGVSQIGAGAEDMSLRLGSTSIPVNAVEPVGLTDVVPGSPLVLATSGMTGDFTAPAAGNYQIKMPSSFVLDAVTNSPAPGLGSLSLACAIADDSGSNILPFTVTKQASAITAKAPKKAVKKGKPAKIVATVAGAFKAATGKVVAKDGSKTVGTSKLKKGKAVFKIKKLKKGAHTITLVYKGDKSTEGSAVEVPVTVK